jgi:hypothetical protein
MPKLTRLTSQYVRRELQRVFRDKYLSTLIRHITAQQSDGARWESFRINFDVESMRMMVEAMEALPRARIERGPANLLREYRKELTIWKRKRTTARARVAKYTRLVRYHSKPGKRRGGGNSESIDKWGAGMDVVLGQRPDSAFGRLHLLVKGQI